MQSNREIESVSEAVWIVHITTIEEIISQYETEFHDGFHYYLMEFYV